MISNNNKELIKLLKLVNDIRDFAYFKWKERVLKYEEEYKEYKNWTIEQFIEEACKVRNIPAELQHRIIKDFIWFVSKALNDDIYETYDTWLWDFKKWLYHFWRFYKILFTEIIKIDEL